MTTTRAKAYTGRASRSTAIGAVHRVGAVVTGWTTDPGPYDAAAIAALNERLQQNLANGLFDVTVSPTSPPGGAYLVAVYLDDVNGAGAGDVFVGDVAPGDATETQTGLVLNLTGSPQSFTVLRSDFAIEAPNSIRWKREA